MTKPGRSVAPTQEGLPISKDVWMLGIGIGLLTRALVERKPAPSKAALRTARKTEKAARRAAKRAA
jgi:hypothetical protein